MLLVSQDLDPDNGQDMIGSGVHCRGRSLSFSQSCGLMSKILMSVDTDKIESTRPAAKQSMGDEAMKTHGLKSGLDAWVTIVTLCPRSVPLSHFTRGHLMYAIHAQWHAFVPGDEGVITVGRWLADEVDIIVQ
jgi:hypothetical protein